MFDLLALVRGCTFDDFLFTPQYSVVERRDPVTIDLTSRFSRRLSLERPIVSANMDTVPRADMAIAVAEEGGLGVIDRGFRSCEIEPQVREVQVVKRKQHGVISDPYTIGPDARLSEAAARGQRAAPSRRADQPVVRCRPGLQRRQHCRATPRHGGRHRADAAARGRPRARHPRAAVSLLETEWELMQAKYGQSVAAAKTRYAAGL